jgi:hypothetical protein
MRESAVTLLVTLLPELAASSEPGGPPALPPPARRAPRPATERVEAIAEFLRAHPYSRVAEIVVAAGVGRDTVEKLLRDHPERFTSAAPEATMAGRAMVWAVVEESAQTVLRAA